MSPRFLIYGLVDPRTGEIRYIGKSATGMKRPNLHRKPSLLRRDCTYKARWVRALHRLGLTYSIEVLEYLLDREGLNAAERYWISEAKCNGWRLTNLTDGGDGLSGMAFTPEHRAKISAANKGRKLSEDQRRRLSEIAKLRPPNPQGIAILCRANLGTKKPESFKELMRRVHTGKVVTSETRERIGMANGKPVLELGSGKFYPSAAAAARSLGIEVSGIIKVASGCSRLKSTHGHHFKYLTA
jgi:hypothetical protein